MLDTPLNARLYPDMFALTRQVQIASDNAKFGAARLAGVEAPKFEDDETNFAELQDRISKTIAFLDTITPQQLEGSENRDIILVIHDTKHEMKGLQYLLDRVQPNFYFHITTAYGVVHGPLPWAWLPAPYACARDGLIKSVCPFRVGIAFSKKRQSR